MFERDSHHQIEWPVCVDSLQICWEIVLVDLDGNPDFFKLVADQHRIALRQVGVVG